MNNHRKGISLDITKVVYINFTVIIDLCLQLALYMGFSEVYLLGCDCDVFDKQTDSEDSHFHSSYPDRRFPIQRDTTKWFDNVVKSYATAKEVFERHGRKIYNAGVGGKLEVFERVNYDELF